MVAASGHLVFEPYLWQPGVVTRAVGSGAPSWTVKRVRAAVAQKAGNSVGDETYSSVVVGVDVDELRVPIAAGGVPLVDYLLDLEPRPSRK